MSIKLFNRKPKTVDEAIEVLTSKRQIIVKKLDDVEYGTDEFYMLMNDLREIDSMILGIKGEPEKKSFKIDWGFAGTCVAAAAGIIVTAMTLTYEEENVVSSATRNLGTKFIKL